MNLSSPLLVDVFLFCRLTVVSNLNASDKGKKIATVTLAVGRSFKNQDGIYETDFIRCILWDGIAVNTKEYCKKGDVVGIKGRLQVESYEKDGQKKYITNVVAEKVTFLSSNHDNDK